METAKEIRSSLQNIQYYSNRIKELTKLQMEKDVNTGHLLGIDTGAGTIRFDSIGTIQAAGEWIEVYCENIENNLKSAEAQDKKLLPKNE